MITKAIHLSVILLLFSSFGNAQTPWIDSVKKELLTQKADTTKVGTLISLSNTYGFSYPDSGLLYAQKALALANDLDYDQGVFWSIVAVNGSLYVLGDYLQALDYAFKALPIAKKLNDPFAISYSYGMLSDCYFNFGEYRTALSYWREVVKITERKFPDKRYAIYGNSARIFDGLHQYDSALIYAKKSYELFKHNPSAIKEDKWAQSSIFMSLGHAYTGKAYYDSALTYYRMSIPFSEEAQLTVNKIDAYNGIAKLYKENNNLDSAIWYAHKVLAERIIKTYPVGRLNAISLLAEIYELRNNKDSTLKYLRLALQGKDQLFNKDKIMAFQNIVFKEQEKRKEVEAATLKLQNEYRMYGVIALFLMLMTIVWVIIRNRRIKQLQNIRNSIADDLHDDIGSALSGISIMNELAKEKSPEALPLLASIGENTAAIQENMSDIVWAVNPKNDRFGMVLQRMKQFASEMLETKNIELDFRSDETTATSGLQMEQRKNLYLFFKEAINNAAKHSGAKKVVVDISKKDNHIDMNITDNGKGFDTSEVFHGNGMSTLKKRAKELNSVFNITSQINKGTSVNLKFKIT